MRRDDEGIPESVANDVDELLKSKDIDELNEIGNEIEAALANDDDDMVQSLKR